MYIFSLDMYIFGLDIYEYMKQMKENMSNIDLFRSKYEMIHKFVLFFGQVKECKPFYETMFRSKYEMIYKFVKWKFMSLYIPADDTYICTITIHTCVHLLNTHIYTVATCVQ